MDIKDRALPEYRLTLHPLSEEARKARHFSKWSPQELGQRSRIGGAPEFIQEPDWPACTKCGSAMTFYAQLDAIGDEYDIADSGLIYVFICFNCFETKSFIHSY